jgi:hypothetical protein
VEGDSLASINKMKNIRVLEGRGEKGGAKNAVRAVTAKDA